MAKQRFRDTKKGKITKTNQKKQNEQKINFARKIDYFKAFLTDSFMLLMPIMYIVFYAVFGSREEFANHMLTGWIYILVPLAIVEILFLYKASQTPGMRAYNLELIFLPTKKKPPLTTIILRQILSKFTFLFFGWIVLFLNKDNRNLHDFITGTALVYKEQNESKQK
jgi:uncharacterized RDD family membrane protein YckC